MSARIGAAQQALCYFYRNQARRSGMDGADLLELSKQQLCTEVLLTPLAARKVVAARDEFLCH